MKDLKNSNEAFTLAKFLKDVAFDVVIVVLLVLFIRSFLFAPFQVHGPSMCDTFNSYDDKCFSGDGEFILTSRLSTWDIFGWTPTVIDRGDVIVFQAPYGEKGQFFIKRVIGLPGDTILIEEGYVHIIREEDGAKVRLDEPYLNDINLGHTEPHRSFTEEFTVPDGTYFALGDNRTQSSDSRRCFRNLGCDEGHSPFLDEDLIEGEVKLVLFPFSHFRLVKNIHYGF